MKTIVNLAEALILLFLSPALLAIRASRSRETRQLRFLFWSEFLSTWPFAVGSLVRRVFYRHTLQKCGSNPVVRHGAIFIHPESELGNNVLVANRCVIGLCNIGDDVMLSHHVSILSGRHHHVRAKDTSPLRLQGGHLKRIRIGHDVWIGAGAIIMDDVGDHAVIGAGAVVVKPVPAGATVVGNPGRILVTNRIGG